MNLSSLSPQQLRQAAEIKEKIQNLQGQLDRLFGSSELSTQKSKGGFKMSPASRATLGLKMKKIWAERRARSKTSATVKSGKKMSVAARAKISAKLKKIWAERKAANAK